MTFKEYVKGLNELLDKRPELSENQVIYAKEDIDNEFNKVFYSATRGYYDSDDGTFIEYSKFEENGLDDDYVNAVCVN